MSSKLKLKSTAGGSLSLIVDDTLATDEEMNISDGGIVTVTNANGTAIKFPDGTMITKTEYVATSACTLAIGNMFRSDYQVITLPETFIDNPSVSASNAGVGGISGNSNEWSIIASIQGSKSSVGFRSYAPTSQAGTLLWEVTAIGRWK